MTEDPTTTQDQEKDEDNNPVLLKKDGSFNLKAIYGGEYDKFKALVKEYIDDLHSISMGWEQSVSRTYDYALNLIQWHHAFSGGSFTPAHQHKLAAKLLKDATLQEANGPQIIINTTPAQDASPQEQ